MDLTLNVTKLCNIIKNSINNNKYKIIGEVNQPKLSQGHLYLTLKDDTSSIKAIIWKSKLDKNLQIKEGDKITVIGKLDYYAFSGTINFIIDSIIENEGIGNLQQKYELLKQNYINKGYFNKEAKLTLPNIIKNILILTSSNGAAIHDFIFNLENNHSNIKYEIIDVPVQGAESPKIIANKLDELNSKELDYDLVVITRGGGSYQDLFGFSDAVLIESVFHFKKIPILSAIGHQVDNPLLDLVADYSCPTPSIAAQFLVDINKLYLSNLNNIKNQLKEQIINRIHDDQKKLLLLNNRLRDEFSLLIEIKNNFQNKIISELNNNKIKLEYILKSLDNPNIELFKKDFTKIINNNEINKKDVLIMRWNNQEYLIKIM
jgi:exodeoxyribonuclease VII large subunit